MAYKYNKRYPTAGNPNWKKGVSANPSTMFKPGQSGNLKGRPRRGLHRRPGIRFWRRKALNSAEMLKLMREIYGNQGLV